MEDVSDLERIRRLPGMYVGSCNQSGVQQLVFEAIDNAIDQFLVGNALYVDVQIFNNRVRIADDGSGYPFDRCAADGRSLGTDYLTRIHTTNTSDGHVPHVHANGFGCGLFTLNALTEHLKIVSVRNGTRMKQEFSRGLATGPIDSESCSEPSGTIVEFEIDPEIFPDPSVDQHLLRTKLRRLASIFPGLTIRLQEESFQSTAGLIDIIKHEMQVHGGPTFSFQMQFNGCILSAAAAGDSDDQTKIISFANAVPTLEESSHVVGLKRALRRVKWRPAGAAVSVILTSPEYSGPTRQVLNVPGLEKRISDILATAIKHFRTTRV